jgi:hypothetical protein
MAHTSPRRSPPRRASSPRPGPGAPGDHPGAGCARRVPDQAAPDRPGRSARRVDRRPARRCPTSSQACARRDCSRRSGTRVGRDRARHGHRHRHPMREMPVRPQPKQARGSRCAGGHERTRAPSRCPRCALLTCGTSPARPGRCPNPRAGTDRGRARRDIVAWLRQQAGTTRRVPDGPSSPAAPVAFTVPTAV